MFEYLNAMGGRRKISRAGQRRHFAIFFRLLAIQRSGRIQIRLCSMLRQQIVHSVFFVRKLYTEQMFVVVSMNILRLS